jgi:two-component system OmpR family response regulator
MAFGEQDVYAITDKGNVELKSAGTSLSAAELEVLVLVDGQSTVAQIAQHAGNLKPADVNVILRKLFKNSLITTATEPTSDGLESGFFTIAVPAGFFSKVTEQTNVEAEQGVTTLNQKGYFVRIARRPAAARQVKEGEQITVLVVDDDPDLLKLLRTYISLEGYAVRTAEKRDDIVGAFRKAPIPNIVLLDVELPDANGFDVLAKMRQHPLLKTVPVIMLTGSATREAVIRGLQAGADGYVTKPFEPDHVMSAIKAVLGFSGAAEAKPADGKPAEGKWADDKPK